MISSLGDTGIQGQLEVGGDRGSFGFSAIAHGRQSDCATQLFSRPSITGLCDLGGPLASGTCPLSLTRGVSSNCCHPKSTNVCPTLLKAGVLVGRPNLGNTHMASFSEMA